MLSPDYSILDSPTLDALIHVVKPPFKKEHSYFPGEYPTITSSAAQICRFCKVEIDKYACCALLIRTRLTASQPFPVSARSLCLLVYSKTLASQ